MKKLLVLVIGVLCLGVVNAYALVTPTIDGSITEAGEWSQSQLYGTDTTESDIDDEWDIKALYMKVIAGDGWYFRMDTHGTPTFAGGPGSGGEEAAFKFFLDIDNDANNDYLIDLNNRNYTGLEIVSVYYGPPSFTEIGTTGTSNAISSIIELYVPNSLLSTDVFFDNAANPFGLFSRLDGNGGQPDDFMPNSGYLKTPEPGSAMLLVMGLLGFAGTIRRKFMA